ncbi:MAG: phytoene desaturase [Ignavibacteriales bacterium]|jgi:phytoene desaturase|nr:MAG: phytoene desaturase [Ignavibacteriales bacterium]
MAYKKVAIIGSGIGGLSTALRLSVLGYEVDVYEQSNSVGGKANEINKNGFRFDTGPSLLTMPFVLEDLFTSSGLNLSDYIEIKKLDVLCKYFYPDSTKIIAYSELDKFAEEIEFNTNDKADDIKKYLNYCKNIYDLSADLFLFKSFSEKKNFISKKAINTLLNIKKLDTHRTMHEANSSFFKDDKTIQLFDRYATYNGSNPFQAPATLNVIQHVEYNLGGYISNDGIYSIPKAIEKASRLKGVNFFFNSPVQKIIHEKKAIKGIEVNGKQLDYDIVVSNSDVENTYKNLLNDNSSSSVKKYSKLEKSSSALVFYWGIEGIYSELEIHNILFSEDYQKEFDDLFTKKITPTDPTIYIYISSKFQKDDAPEGHENWFVMINVPYNNQQDWEKEIQSSRQTILEKLNRILGIDIENKKVFEEVLTPELIEKKTSSISGSIYGISSNNKMAAFLRQQNKSKEYKGLYFCGGSAHPGGGIPLVILSGKITAELIEKYEIK